MVNIRTSYELDMLSVGSIVETRNKDLAEFIDAPVLVRQEDGWYGAWDWEIAFPAKEILPVKVIREGKK